MIFVLFTLIGMYFFRKIGWLLSRNVLYGANGAVVVFVCILWGAGIAYLLHLLIAWQNPNLILKIIFGYGFGLYISIPNYGLLNESSIPLIKKNRHLLIKAVPFFVFIITSILFAFKD